VRTTSISAFSGDKKKIDSKICIVSGQPVVSIRKISNILRADKVAIEGSIRSEALGKGELVI
jgi:hypothetical protein